MKKIHMTLLVLSSYGCGKHNLCEEWRPQLTTQQMKILSAAMPTMYFGWGDISADFSHPQIMAVRYPDNDSISHEKLYGADNYYCMLIKLPGDTVLPGNYNLDGRNGMVWILRNGGYEVGRLSAACYFSISISKSDYGLDGLFSGTLLNVVTGHIDKIEGGMHSITRF